jgi:Golgi apparatus protein 1
MRIVPAVALAGVMTSILSLAPAVAQSPLDRILQGVKKLEQGCAEDLSKFCSTVTPGEGRLFFCILAHEDKLSQKCDYALFSAARNLERALDRVAQVADACWTDIEQNCADSAPGGGRVMQCLVAKASSLSPGCRSTLTALQTIK